MRAIVVEKFGAEPVLVDTPAPDPGPGQVQVAIAAASVNPLDQAAAAGYLAGVGSWEFPLVLGFDGAGVVSAVGEGVSSYSVGDRVYGQFWDAPQRWGTFAESTMVSAQPGLGALARIPDGLSDAVAAALPTAAMTAVAAVEAAGVQSGQRVLLLGAAGGVGTSVLQVAAARGITVIASASLEQTDQLRALGAASVVPRAAADLEEAVRGAAPQGVDAVLDTTGDAGLVAAAAAAGAVRQGGVVTSIAYGVPDALRTDSRVRVVDFQLERKAQRLAAVSELAAAGTLTPVITGEVAFSDALGALGGLPGRPGQVRGKTILRVTAQP